MRRIELRTQMSRLHASDVLLAGVFVVAGAIFLSWPPPVAGADASSGVRVGAPGVAYIDPETHIGADEVFVFYTVYSPDGIEVWRAGTGIRP
jgi:hypothetical protein